MEGYGIDVNQKKWVGEPSPDPPNGAFNFVNGASQSGEYTYDQNGNLTKDLNKNISSISYNLLNLPTNISYSSGKSAAYIYDATGRKLRTSYKASASATAVPTDYCGNMIYEDGVLKLILVDGGYMTVTGTPFYFYYLQDHLGSNRVVVSPAGTATQVNHYYPFGGLFGESTGNTVQRFRYNDKEFDRTHGIDWYDYGARHMTPDAGRFTTIDPMAEKYYSISPYAYCHNNPISRIDINGNWDVTVHLAQDRNKNGYGIAIVSDKNGEEVFRFDVRAEGVKGHNRMVKGSDSPLGTYDIPDKNPWIKGGRRDSYGPNYRLVMNPESGEIIESGRVDIRIHGGRQEIRTKNGNWIKVDKPELKKTEGCLRAYDDDMKNFKDITDNLQKSDELENPGKVIIKDDYDEFIENK